MDFLACPRPLQIPSTRFFNQYVSQAEKLIHCFSGFGIAPEGFPPLLHQRHHQQQFVLLKSDGGAVGVVLHDVHHTLLLLTNALLVAVHMGLIRPAGPRCYCANQYQNNHAQQDSAQGHVMTLWNQPRQLRQSSIAIEPYGKRTVCSIPNTSSCLVRRPQCVLSNRERRCRRLLSLLLWTLCSENLSLASTYTLRIHSCNYIDCLHPLFFWLP